MIPERENLFLEMVEEYRRAVLSRHKTQVAEAAQGLLDFYQTRELTPDVYRPLGVDIVRYGMGFLKVTYDRVENVPFPRMISYLDIYMDAPPPNAELMKFYNVTTPEELIAAQARHIEKLQDSAIRSMGFTPRAELINTTPRGL